MPIDAPSIKTHPNQWIKVPFGKFQGEPMWVLLTDAPYLIWALNTPTVWQHNPQFMAALFNEVDSDDFWRAIDIAKSRAGEL